MISLCTGGHDVCDGGGGAVGVDEPHAGVLRGEGGAAGVRRG